MSSDAIVNVPPIPAIGEGCTIYIGSDRYPATVIKTEGKKTVIVQIDAAIPTAQHEYYGRQDYEYSRNHNGAIHTFTLRRNGYWIMKGSDMKSGIVLTVGRRDKYIDPSF